MTDSYDVILVGAGHNGLVCASYLAKAGRKVLVLEAADKPGGAAATREFAPGYSVSSCAQWLYQLHPRVARDLKLEQHGLELAARDLPSVLLDVEGQHLSVLGALADVAVARSDGLHFCPFMFADHPRDRPGNCRGTGVG